jgi:hypothetical protein
MGDEELHGRGKHGVNTTNDNSRWYRPPATHYASHGVSLSPMTHRRTWPSLRVVVDAQAPDVGRDWTCAASEECWHGGRRDRRRRSRSLSYTAGG